MNLKSTRSGFGDCLVELGSKQDDIVVITADLRGSTKVKEFAQKFPKKFYDVGVAEQNLASVAAGLALSGKKVFATSFACFSPALNWAQIRQSICYNGLNVVIVGSHGGLATGPDGATHQSLEDVALMNVLPNMTIVAPADYEQAYLATKALYNLKTPSYLRLARPVNISFSQLNIEIEEGFNLGKAQKIKSGRKATLIGYGPILPEILSMLSARKLNTLDIFNVHTLKPFDFTAISKSLQKTKRLIVLEDHQKIGGLGSIVSYELVKEGIKCDLKHLAVDGQFGCSARNHKSLWKKLIDSLEILV